MGHIKNLPTGKLACLLAKKFSVLTKKRPSMVNLFLGRGAWPSVALNLVPQALS